MRVAGWKATEIFESISRQAFANAEALMDEVKETAKSLCRVGTITRGAAKNSKVWSERKPGSLKRSIRRVGRSDKGNVRVYAGNFEVYYARFVEMGTVKTKKQPFLRPAFLQKKSSIIARIKNG